MISLQSSNCIFALVEIPGEYQIPHLSSLRSSLFFDHLNSLIKRHLCSTWLRFVVSVLDSVLLVEWCCICIETLRVWFTPFNFSSLQMDTTLSSNKLLKNLSYSLLFSIIRWEGSLAQWLIRWKGSLAQWLTSYKSFENSLLLYVI